jgi:hypothetical protein
MEEVETSQIMVVLACFSEDFKMLFKDFIWGLHNFEVCASQKLYWFSVGGRKKWE